MFAEPRHRSWDDIRELLPVGWQVGPTSYEPGNRRWTVVARAANTGVRGKPPETVVGEGEDELHALTELALKLGEMACPRQMADLERRARQAFLAGAEEHSRRDQGPGLTDEELGGSSAGTQATCRRSRSSH